MYHPSAHDLFVPGGLSRSVIRAVDAADSAYVRSMFVRAAAGRPIILACYTHNFGSTVIRNNSIKGQAKRLYELCLRYSDSLEVPFRYCSASEAVNRLQGLESGTGFTLSANYSPDRQTVSVDYDSTMFGVPLICTKINSDIVGAFMEWSPGIGKWTYTLDNANVDSFVVAGVSRHGQAFTWGPMAR